MAILAYYYRNQPTTLINICESGDNAIRLLAKSNMDFYVYNSSCAPVGFTDEKVRFNGELITLCEATWRFLDEEYF